MVVVLVSGSAPKKKKKKRDGRAGWGRGEGVEGWQARRSCRPRPRAGATDSLLRGFWTRPAD